MVSAAVSKAMAETQLFPKIFAQENKLGSPVFGLILGAVLMTILLLLTTSRDLVAQFELIILMAVLAALIPYFYTTISCILVIKQQDKNSPFWQAGIIIAVLACAYSFWTILGSGQEVVYYGMILFFLGTPIYAIAEWVNLQKGKH